MFIDEVKYEIYSPQTNTSARNILSTLKGKEEQSKRFIVNLGNSNVTKEQLGNVIGRIRGMGNKTVQEVVFIKNDEIMHQALANGIKTKLNYLPKP